MKMDGNRLQQARDKANELIKYDQKTYEIIEFIEKLKENNYLRLVTIHQGEMWTNAEDTFALVGEELISLLDKKVDERLQYIASVTPEDLVRLPCDDSTE